MIKVTCDKEDCNKGEVTEFLCIHCIAKICERDAQINYDRGYEAGYLAHQEKLKLNRKQLDL